MEFRPLETIQVGKKRYVLRENAAKFLGVSFDRLNMFIMLGRIATVQVESRQMIELDVLMDFDVSKFLARRGR